ncbi:MAG: TonB-dependent receptor domain-containing protein [Vulcanimicrobiaceae bacterium]
MFVLFKHSLALALLAALVLSLVPGTVTAGTTGTIRGRVLDASTDSPVAGATVTATSPSQTATTVTDSGGHFSFISLAPDTYSVSAQKTGFDPQSQPGVSVFADQSANVSLTIEPQLKTIARTTSRSSSSLVRSGTTSDVYSVNPAGQKAATALAGSGALTQAYSAIAAAPGVAMPTGQQGWYQSVYVRGGDYDQVAYEFDGVPVIRESDGAPIVTLSALGQQEVQVYTGGTPATSDSPGLAGYINQVIKTGTTPGYISLNGAVGGPTFYHQAAFEAGGASPNRQFSYYVATAGANQSYRYGNQFNGTGDPLYFFPLYVPTNNNVYHILDGSGGTAANNYGAYFQPGSINGQAYNADRETVVNLHYRIPHRKNLGQDDIQGLYVVGNIFTNWYSSANDIGVANVALCTPGDPSTPYCNPSSTANFWPGFPIPWLDSTYYNGALMQSPNPNELVNGPFPSSPTQRSLNNPTVNGFPATSTFVDPAERDTSSNAFAIEKFQYQHNFNDSSYLRFAAYGEYTNWFIFGGNAAQLTFGAALPDYEVLGHIYGGNLTYANQLSPKHLLTARFSYMTQKLQTYNAGFGATGLGTIISSYADKNGNCYNFATGAIWSCYDAGSQGGLQADGTINLSPGTAPAGSPAALAGANWIMTENGHTAQVDNVVPYFSSGALTDVYHPNEKLTVNLGVRLDDYTYRLDNLESNYPARQFWFNAFNRENCGGVAGLGPVSTFDPNSGTFGACPAGFTPMWNGTEATPGVGLTNVTGSTTSSFVLQPRVAFTWAMRPDTVLRGSYGRYARPAATSYRQYNTYQQDLPSFISQFYSFGYTTPDHTVLPDTSDNYDISWEQHLKGTDMSFKITPFYRKTKNQLQYLAINPLQGILAGINVGTQINSGVEVSFQKGDFARDGLSLLLSYTHMTSKVKYAPVANGASVIDTLNTSIQQYNSYTSACAGAAVSTTLCGSGAFSGNALPVLPNNQAPAGSPSLNIANPYFNSPAQPLLDRNGWYAPYDITPSPFTAANGYETPDVASLILNYRKGRFAITPTISYSSGSVYGSPLVYPGYVPQSCAADPAATPATPGVSCSGGSIGALFLPDPYTGKFDAPGSFHQPWQLSANLQMSYDINPRVTVTLIANNIFNKCYQWGTVWDTPTTCIYSNLPSNILAPSGNFLAKSSTPIQVLYPYGNWFNNTQVGYTSALQPFQLTVGLNVKL